MENFVRLDDYICYLHHHFQAINIFIFQYFIHLNAFCFQHAFSYLHIRRNMFPQFVLFTLLVCHNFPLFFQCQSKWRHLLLLFVVKYYESQQWQGRTTNRTGRLNGRVSFCSCSSLTAFMRRILQRSGLPVAAELLFGG